MEQDITSFYHQGIVIRISSSRLPICHPCCLFYSPLLQIPTALVDWSLERGGRETGKGEEEKSGGLLKIQSGPTKEEGRRLVGETGKRASCVSNTDLVTLLLSSCFLSLTRLPSPAVRHPSAMSLILNLFIFLYLSFFFPFSPRWSLRGQPYRAVSYWKYIAFWRKKLGENQPKTWLQLCVTFLAQQKVISFPLLTGPYL